MASDTEIANLALGHIGVSQTIQDLTTDTTNEAKAINRYFDTARREILREINWPFATTTLALAEIEEDPTTEWGYSYSYPSDCIRAIRIFSGTRNETDTSWVAFRVHDGGGVNVIYTDQDSACLEYTKDMTDPQLYPDDFKMAFSYLLAFYVAPTLMTGDPFKLRDAAGQLYRAWVRKAAANAYNESPRENKPKSAFVRSRND